MIKRIHNEKDTTQCLSKGRGETGCRREQQANRIRYRFSPLKEIEISAIHGKQRFGFEYSNSVISGINSNIDISKIYYPLSYKRS